MPEQIIDWNQRMVGVSIGSEIFITGSTYALGTTITDEIVAAFSYVYSGDLITQMIRTTSIGSEVKDLTYSGVLVSTIGSWY